MIETGEVIRRRVVAHGRVQGVFFRDTCRRQALAYSVSGWVANREDGAVEAVFEGEPYAVKAMVDWARRGSVHATVISRIPNSGGKPASAAAAFVTCTPSPSPGAGRPGSTPAASP